MDNEISEGRAQGGGGASGEGIGDRDMHSERGGDHARACGGGSCAFVRIGATAHVAGEADAVHQREDIEEADDGVQAHTEDVLGTAHMGEGVFCGDIGECDGRGGTGVHSAAAGGGTA